MNEHIQMSSVFFLFLFFIKNIHTEIYMSLIEYDYHSIRIL